MKKLLPGFFCMCLLLLYHQAAAQMVSISGKVTGYFGLTMPGVSVKPCHFERSSKVG